MNSVYHRSESVLFVGPKRLEMLPDDCKDVENLDNLKNKIDKQKPENCPFKICINNAGFIENKRETWNIQ